MPSPAALAALASLILPVISLPQPFVNMMTPVMPTYSSQTKAQGDRSLAVGRFPDRLELLRPSLDNNLVSYSVTTESLSGNYTFAASDVLATISQRWLGEFMRMYPNVTFNIHAPYAGSLGALELVKGNLQGVFVSRELKPTDVSGFKDAFGYDPTSVPIAGGSYRQFGFLDAISFITHKDNPIESLSFKQLDSIFSSTRNCGGNSIGKWGDVGVNGTLADKDINIYGITPWNGFEEFVRQKVLSCGGKRGEWRSGEDTNTTKKDPHVTWEETVFNVSRLVSEDPTAIGYTGLAYVDSPVKVLGVSTTDDGPVIAPTYENVALADWPLSRVIYFNTNTDPKAGMDPVLRELQKFVISKEGQKLLLDQGVFLPLRKFQQDSSSKMLS
uniref:PBP domain-containing protein n=2 Tax=Bionectria ochroleuca TaxID=29856 RepID=A0A0B7K659_BIOOC